MPKSFHAAAAAALAILALPGLAHGQSNALPDGPGRQTVEQVCVACHPVHQIRNSSGYTQDGWRALIQTMLPLGGTPELEEISAYLAAHFPPHARRAPRLMPGDMTIALQEWVSPTLGQRTRDPEEAPDGAIWYAGQWSDSVGRIDLKTGDIREYPLPANAKPHSVNVDRDGSVWYTGNGNGTMGWLDPKTGEIKVYKMPDPAARDPHTAMIDSNGTIWFTLQQSNMVGRLIPATGDIKLVTMPVPRARPYGIKLDSKETPWVASNGSGHIFRIDRETMEVRAFPLVEVAGTTVRRLDIAADDTIWYVNSSLGRLGRLDPRTGEAREWPSPSGPKSHPYAIAILDGAIWYNESGQRPDALVRFDPATETFQSWPIPSGDVFAGIIRHMRTTQDGQRLLIHQSSTNRVLMVTPQKPVQTQ